jgi:hypothetical protein
MLGCVGGVVTMLEQLRAALQGEEGEEGEEGGVCELAAGGGLGSDTAEMRDTSTILRRRHS